MSILIAILVFGGIILIHELGHFYAARKCGIKVEEFAIGMGPKLWACQPGETVYSLRLFPIGGSCRMLGEDERNEDSRAFNNKPVWKRMIVILAGVFMNFLLALIIMTGIIFISGYTVPAVNTVTKDTPAEQIGLIPGDEIIEAGGTKINIYQDLTFVLMETQNKTIPITILRNGEKLVKQVAPYAVKEKDGSIGYKIGFRPMGRTGLFAESVEGFERAGFFDSVGKAFYTNVFYVKTALDGLTKLFTMRISVDQMSGPVGVVTVIGEAYEAEIKEGIGDMVITMLHFMAFLSVNVGVFNLLPIPALDGGRFVFLAIEGIFKKPIKRETEGMIHFVGFALLMILTVFILYNDILKLVK